MQTNAAFQTWASAGTAPRSVGSRCDPCCLIWNFLRPDARNLKPKRTAQSDHPARGWPSGRLFCACGFVPSTARPLSDSAPLKRYVFPPVPRASGQIGPLSFLPKAAFCVTSQSWPSKTAAPESLRCHYASYHPFRAVHHLAHSRLRKRAGWPGKPHGCGRNRGRAFEAAIRARSGL